MATPEERRALVFSAPHAVAAEAYLTAVLQPFLEALAGAFARLQPDRPAAFAKSFARGEAYEGEMRGEDVFNEESAATYMTVLGGPLLAELMATLLALPADKRPAGKNGLDAWVVANVDALAAKVDAASVKITSGLRGIAARKRVSRMKADPELRERQSKAAASGAYAPGAVSGKAAKRAGAAKAAAAAAAGPAGSAADVTNQSHVGRGVEEQVAVADEAFAQYLAEQKRAAGGDADAAARPTRARCAARTSSTRRAPPPT